MPLARPVRRWIAWLALLASVLAALAPAVSHALGASPGASAAEVCTVDGSRWVPSGNGSDSRPVTAVHALGHCPYCPLQQDLPAVPPPGAATRVAARTGAAACVAFASAPRSTSHAWLSAPPRAPPPFA